MISRILKELITLTIARQTVKTRYIHLNNRKNTFTLPVGVSKKLSIAYFVEPLPKVK